MKLFYSSGRRGFYSPEVHDPMPADAVHRVTPKRHAELLAAQEQGAKIVPGKHGKPALEWPDRSLTARRAELVRMVKREARRRIDRVSPVWRQLNDTRDPTPEGSARFAAIDAIRAASAAIEAEIAPLAVADLEAFPLTDNQLWPEVA